MAHFAELNENNVVLRVIVVHNNELLDENNIEQEQKGIDFCINLFGGTWVQTSYNANFRNVFAGIGMTYDKEKDIFIPNKPFASWVFNPNLGDWEAPVPRPEITNTLGYKWNEEGLEWLPVIIFED
jgi:hypothetical protein